MEGILKVNEFAIQELECIEAPMSSEEKAGIAVGVLVGLELVALGAIAAC